MLSQSVLIAACCAIISNASIQDDRQRQDVFQTREEAIDSISGLTCVIGNEIEYRKAEQRTLVVWNHPTRIRTSCIAGVFIFDPQEKTWHRTFHHTFEETKEITVESQVSKVILRNEHGKLLYDSSREAKRFKGVELYSWKNDEDEWEFALLDGSNRLKTASEIRDAADRVQGVTAIKKRLAKLAVDETVIWNPHQFESFPPPDAMTRAEICKAAELAGIQIE